MAEHVTAFFARAKRDRRDVVRLALPVDLDRPALRSERAGLFLFLARRAAGNRAESTGAETARPGSPLITSKKQNSPRDLIDSAMRKRISSGRFKQIGQRRRALVAPLPNSRRRFDRHLALGFAVGRRSHGPIEFDRDAARQSRSRLDAQHTPTLRKVGRQSHHAGARCPQRRRQIDRLADRGNIAAHGQKRRPARRKVHHPPAAGLRAALALKPKRKCGAAARCGSSF